MAGTFCPFSKQSHKGSLQYSANAGLTQIALPSEWPVHLTSDMQLSRAEVLRGLRNFLNMDRPEHHGIDRLKERGVEKGLTFHPPRTRTICVQPDK